MASAIREVLRRRAADPADCFAHFLADLAVRELQGCGALSEGNPCEFRVNPCPKSGCRWSVAGSRFAPTGTGPSSYACRRPPSVIRPLFSGLSVRGKLGVEETRKINGVGGNSCLREGTRVFEGDKADSGSRKGAF